MGRYDGYKEEEDSHRMRGQNTIEVFGRINHLALSTTASSTEASTPSASVTATLSEVSAAASTEKRAQTQLNSSTAPESLTSATAEATPLEAAT